MALKYTFKLKADASPHLYIHQLKLMMADDTYLHPLMRNTLILMKKMRTPFVRLATLKEIIFVPEKFLHLERALEPAITGFAKIEWCAEEKELYKNKPKEFWQNILGLYERLGYEMSKEDIDMISVENILNSLQTKKDD